MVDAGILVWVQTCKLLLPDVDHCSRPNSWSAAVEVGSHRVFTEQMSERSRHVPNCFFPLYATSLGMTYAGPGEVVLTPRKTSDRHVLHLLLSAMFTL